MSIYQQIASIEKTGEAFVFCTIVSSSGSTPRHEGSKMLVFSDGKISGTVGGGLIEHLVIEEALKALKERKNKILKYSLVNPEKGDPGICGGQVEVYVEPIIPKLTLVVVGAGHVGKQVAHLGKWLDYRVVITDERPEFCNPVYIPEADEYIICPISEIPQLVKINPFTFLVLTTKSSSVDVEGLPVLLETETGYIGVIGSKRRWELTKKELLDKGITKEKIDKIHSPMGLELNAETPQEIALSIIAEVMMVANASSGKMMKSN
ncbi:MAG: xanthine dehydrogenase [Chlorobiaceae bacterium]|nr:MAG: xanthine dehydrogenase accessory factor [Chloroflexota bacterium]MBA4311012.1 xanthine dehydrogenase [Chlorobiaceae bacterium]